MDGTMVADPSNMYLSPDKGFKYSLCNNPYNHYSFTTMGDIPHGRVSYDLNVKAACYIPASDQVGHVIYLIPGEDDTIESWFKVGGADAIADKLIAEGQAQPCLIISGPEKDADKVPEATILRASDYKTWQERRKALERILKK